MAQRASVEEVLRYIVGARKNVQLYPQDHPAVRTEIEALAGSLRPFVYGNAEFVLHVVAGELFMGDTAMSRETLQFQDLVAELQSRHIHTLVFQRGLTEDELYELVHLLNEPEQFWLDCAGSLDSELSSRGVVHARVRAGAVLSAAEEHAGSVYRPTERQNAVVIDYRRAVDTLWQMGRDVFEKRTFDVKTVRAVVATMLLHLAEEKDMCARLANIKSFDDYTFNHSVNVSLVSMLIGSQLGLSTEHLEVLGTAAMLHDFGKLTIPPEILHKQHALTEEEWVEIRAHPVRGAQLIIEQEIPEDISATVAFEHHAGFNGQGYPTLMPGKKQHLFSRIVAIADVYDALSSPRVYRRQLSPDGAVKHIVRGRDKDFDPLLTQVFFSVTGLYPVGTTVQLNTGEMGIVHSVNESAPTRPVVRLVRDASGAQMPAQLVNLLHIPEDQLWVKKTMPAEQAIDSVQITAA